MTERRPRESVAPRDGSLSLNGFDPRLVSLKDQVEAALEGPFRLSKAFDQGDSFADVPSRKGGVRSLAGYFEVEKVVCGDCGVHEHTLAGTIRVYRTGEVEVEVSDKRFKPCAYDIEGFRAT